MDTEESQLSSCISQGLSTPGGQIGQINRERLEAANTLNSVALNGSDDQLNDPPRGQRLPHCPKCSPMTQDVPLQPGNCSRTVNIYL